MTKTRANLALLLGASALTLALFWVPYGHYVIYPLVLLSTLAHELGHGVAGVLVGGDFEAFVMYADGSGMARVSGVEGRVARAIVAAGGLVGPALVAAVGLRAARTNRAAHLTLGFTGALLLLACVLVVRNVFGLLFVGTTGALLLWFGWKGSERLAAFLLLFLSTQLALSVFTRADYLFTETAQTAAGDAPSDVANIASALLLPYWFWGALLAAFSVAVLAWGLRAYVVSGRRG